jgi:hypothetical protein
LSSGQTKNQWGWTTTNLSKAVADKILIPTRVYIQSNAAAARPVVDPTDGVGNLNLAPSVSPLMHACMGELLPLVADR